MTTIEDNRKSKDILTEVSYHRDMEFLLNDNPKDISIDVINKIIANLLIGKGNKYSDALIIHIVKAFTYNLIPKEFQKYNIKIINQSKIDLKSKLKNTVGLVGKNTIYFEKNSILSLKNSNFEIINTIFHEIHHLKQRTLINNNNISYDTYLLTMEQVIVQAMKDDYYQDNYWYLYEEVDARYIAAKETYCYIKNICPSLANDMFVSTIKNVQECHQAFMMLKRKVHNKIYLREELCDRIIRRNPNYLKIFPLLNFFYNDDGSKIPIGTILKRNINCPREDNIVQQLQLLDEEVVKKRGGTQTNLMHDLASLYEDDIIAYCLLDSSFMTKRENVINLLTKRLNEQKYGDNIIDLYDNACNRISILTNNLKTKLKKVKLIPTNIYCLFLNMENPYEEYVLKIKKKIKKIK